MITSAHGTLLRLNAQSFSTSEQVLECYDRIPKYSRSRSSHITPQPLIMGAHLRWKSFLAEAGVWWVGALGYFSRGLRLRKRRPGDVYGRRPRATRHCSGYTHKSDHGATKVVHRVFLRYVPSLQRLHTFWKSGRPGGRDRKQRYTFIPWF